MLAKGRATLYATTSRAKQLQKDYLQSMHAEDLAFSTSNKKKDAARKLQMKVEQHRKEQLEIERRKLIKETLRIERDRYSNLLIGLRNIHSYKNAKISTVFLFDLKKA